MLFETSNLFYNFSPAQQERQVKKASKSGEENYRFPNFSALLDPNTSPQIKNLASDTEITVDKRGGLSSKEGSKEIGSPINNDFYYKHKLILAKKAFSSNSNSPVQSHQGPDCSLPIENSPRNSNQSTEEISPSPVSSPARHHLNPSTERMGLCAESSASREQQESRVAGPSRVEEDEDEAEVKRSLDEDGDGFPNSGSGRRYFRSDDEEDGEEEEDDDDEERRRPGLPDLLPHISSLERQKQLFKEHLLQKYFETCKNFPSNSSNSGSSNNSLNNNNTQDNIFGEQRHIFKQEPLDTYHPHRQQPQELPQLAPPPFGMDSQLSKFYPFPLPHPSLAQQQQQLLYEFSQMKMQKEKKLKEAQEKRNVFCCHICSFVGSSEDDFNSHMSQHFEHQCPHCTYSSRTEGRLKRHVKDFHSNENDSVYTGQQKAKSSTPKRTCRYCKFYTYDQVEFWVHLKKHIKPEKLLECPHCEFVTELKHHLEYHIRVHIGSKPFKCPKCNYSCVNKSMLNSHMKSHTNVYQFRCRDCNYATKYSHSLKLHLLKKKHHADVVLNSDGSLPTDGSGHFDVASRRGPPRGPRVVRARPLSSYSPTLSLNESSAFAPEAGGRIIAHLDDLRVRALQDRDSMMWSDMRQSRSPSEMSGTSRDDHFPIDIHHASANNNLANSFSTYARMMSTRNPLQQQFNCSFCVDRFPSSNLLTEHVESVHLKSAFGSYTLQPETSSGSLLYPGSNLGKSFDIPTTKSEPITEGFDEKVPCESSVTPLDLSSGPKRKPTEDADSRNTLSPASEHGSSRKRARKGRAFKLNPERIGHNEGWSVEDGVDSQATDDILSKENDEGTEEEKEKPMENGKVEKTTIEVAASSSSDEAAVSAAVTAVVKSSPQWKHHEDAVVDTSPKSDSSGETVLHPNDEQKQVSTSASSAASSTQKDIKYGDLKVDSSWHICRHCEMAFADQMTHRLHMGYHGFYNPFQCNGCGENCVDAFDFMLHLMCKAHN